MVAVVFVVARKVACPRDDRPSIVERNRLDTISGSGRTPVSSESWNSVDGLTEAKPVLASTAFRPERTFASEPRRRKFPSETPPS